MRLVARACASQIRLGERNRKNTHAPLRDERTKNPAGHAGAVPLSQRWIAGARSCGAHKRALRLRLGTRIAVEHA